MNDVSERAFASRPFTEVTATADRPEIVLAEDNPAEVGLVRLALREVGLQCDLYIHDGEETIALFEELDTKASPSTVDLLLLDMELPRRCGQEILKSLRSTQNYARTPVIIMTSSEAPVGQAGAGKLAALHYFRKPSNLDEFFQLGTIVRDLLVSKQGSSTREPSA